MFQGFNEATIEYFDCISRDNSRENFKDNIHLYEQGIKEPLCQLYYEFRNFFAKYDDAFDTTQRRCISSAYNDARFCRENPIKEYFYIRYKVLKAEKANTLGFYLDASKENFRYGLNIYKLNAHGMELIHNKILQEPKRAKRIIRALEDGERMDVVGQRYKRSCYHVADILLQEWLDLRTISFCRVEEMNPKFFKRQLWGEMKADFESLQELYFFIREALEERGSVYR